MPNFERPGKKISNNFEDDPMAYTKTPGLVTEIILADYERKRPEQIAWIQRLIYENGYQFIERNVPTGDGLYMTSLEPKDKKAGKKRVVIDSQPILDSDL